MSSPVSLHSLTPPDDSHWVGPMALALVAHALLAAALTWGIGWNRNPQTPVVAEAELWSRLPQSAAPKLAEPTPPPPPEPELEPVVAKPSPPRPDPVAAQQALDAQRDAQIALQQQKKREEARREEEKRLMQEALKKKQAQEREAREKALAKEKEREQEREKALEKEREKQKALKAEKLAAEKKAAEEAKRQALKDQQAKAAKENAAQVAKDKANEKANADRLAKERAENLKRIAGMAGATGSADSTGTAKVSSGPSRSYAGRIVGAVRPNIVYTDTPVGNPTADVEVRTLPDGTIASRRLVKSSGNAAWDDAVLKALDRTARLPRDEDGRVPATLVIGFRPRD